MQMEGSQIMGKGNWKSSIIREIPSASRIFSTDKELPIKFSPRIIQKGNSAKSILKFRSNAYSQDQINMQYSRVQQIRKELEEPTPLIASRSTRINQIKSSLGSLKKNDSHNSVQINRIQDAGIQGFGIHHKKSDNKVIQQLKQEFIQFKDKILKELRKQEVQLDKFITQICKMIHKNQGSSRHIQNQSYTSPIKIINPSTSIDFPKIESYRHQRSEPFVKLEINSPISEIETTKYPPTFSEGQKNNETLIPKIRQSIHRFINLIARLKEDVSNDPFSKIQSVQINSEQ